MLVIPRSPIRNAWRTTLAMLVLTVSCQDSTAADTDVIAPTVVSGFAHGRGGVVVTVGETVQFGAWVYQADSSVAVGARVKWLSLDGGTFESAETMSDGTGYARAKWTAPTVAGEYHFGIEVGEFKSTAVAQVVSAGRPARGVPSVDSIRFTRLGEHKGVTFTFEDKFGNTTDGYGISASVTGPFNQDWDKQGASIWAVGGAGTGVLTIRSSETGTPVLAQVKLVSDPIIKTITLVGMDSAAGVAVGETLPFRVSARDSANNEISGVDLAAAGVVFESSAPSFASVDANGLVTGRATGSALITATRGADRRAVTVPVHGRVDLGAVVDVLSWPNWQLYVHPSASISQTGEILVGTSSTRFPSKAVSAYTPTGQLRWTRGFGYGSGAVFGPNGGTYVTDPVASTLMSIGATGTTRWTLPLGSPTVYRDGVIIARGNLVTAAAESDGRTLWTATVADTIRSVLPSPERIYVRTGPWNGPYRLTAFDLSGVQQWSTTSASAYIADDESRFFYWNSSRLFAYGPSGQELWSLPLTVHGAELGPSGQLVIKSPGTLTSIDRQTGQVRWTSAVPALPGGPLAVGANRVYIGWEYIYAYDLTTGRYLGRTTTPLGTFGTMECTPGGLMVLTNPIRKHPSC
jgi:hypothetical protein